MIEIVSDYGSDYNSRCTGWSVKWYVVENELLVGGWADYMNKIFNIQIMVVKYFDKWFFKIIYFGYLYMFIVNLSPKINYIPNY